MIEKDILILNFRRKIEKKHLNNIFFTFAAAYAITNQL
jgi:hypothetical protein